MIEDPELDALEAQMRAAMRCSETTVAMVRYRFDELSARVRQGIDNPNMADQLAQEVTLLGRRVVAAMRGHGTR